MENKPKRHPSTDCGGKVEMIESSEASFTSGILKGENPWMSAATASTTTISFEDIGKATFSFKISPLEGHHLKVS